MRASPDRRPGPQPSGLAVDDGSPSFPSFIAPPRGCRCSAAPLRPAVGGSSRLLAGGMVRPRRARADSLHPASWRERPSERPSPSTERAGGTGHAPVAPHRHHAPHRRIASSRQPEHAVARCRPAGFAASPYRSFRTSGGASGFVGRSRSHRAGGLGGSGAFCDAPFSPQTRISPVDHRARRHRYSAAVTDILRNHAGRVRCVSTLRHHRHLASPPFGITTIWHHRSSRSPFIAVAVYRHPL